MDLSSSRPLLKSADSSADGPWPVGRLERPAVSSGFDLGNHSGFSHIVHDHRGEETPEESPLLQKMPGFRSVNPNYLEISTSFDSLVYEQGSTTQVDSVSASSTSLLCTTPVEINVKEVQPTLSKQSLPYTNGNPEALPEWAESIFKSCLPSEVVSVEQSTQSNVCRSGEKEWAGSENHLSLRDSETNLYSSPVYNRIPRAKGPELDNVNLSHESHPKTRSSPPINKQLAPAFKKPVKIRYSITITLTKEEGEGANNQAEEATSGEGPGSQTGAESKQQLTEGSGILVRGDWETGAGKQWQVKPARPLPQFSVRKESQICMQWAEQSKVTTQTHPVTGFLVTVNEPWVPRPWRREEQNREGTLPYGKPFTGTGRKRTLAIESWTPSFFRNLETSKKRYLAVKAAEGAKEGLPGPDSFQDAMEMIRNGPYIPRAKAEVNLSNVTLRKVPPPQPKEHKVKDYGKLNPRPGKIIIFLQSGFKGKQAEVLSDVPDATAWNLPHAVSIRVVRGGWVMYEKPRFQGRKCVLAEGDIELTDPWNDEEEKEEKEDSMNTLKKSLCIGSLRLVVKDYGVPEISLFSEENGEGKKQKFRDMTEDIRINGQPIKATSIIVHTGLWLLYNQPFFEGDPCILEPGGYPSLKAWDSTDPNICSLQPIQMGSPSVEKPNEPKIVIYENNDFQGRSCEVNRDIHDLKNEEDAEGLSLPSVGSLRVLGGCWVGYQKEGFRGHQYLLEEGEFKTWKDWGGNSEELASLRLIRTYFSDPALVMFEETDFEEGPSIQLCDALPDVELARFGTITQSIHVLSGVWVAYSNVNFSGEQYILEKGLYRNCQDWGSSDSRICSIQPVLQVGGLSLHYISKIQLFSEPGFKGVHISYDDDRTSLPESFNPQSCRVHGGSWILYDDKEYSGEQYVLCEGEYPTRTAMGCLSEVPLQSLKKVTLYFSEPSISLHGLECFEGKQIELNQEVRSLQAEGFNNHVLSVRVKGGIWVLYEHNDFRGRQWLLDCTEITNWLKYSGLQRIGSLCPIRQKCVYFHIRNEALQLYLCVREDVEEMQAGRVLVSEPSDQAHLVWYYEEGYIKNQVASNMSLQVIGTADKGAKVVLWSQNRLPCQTWRIDPNGHIYSDMFENMILDVKGGESYDQDHVVLWDMAEARPSQIWKVEVL